MTLDAPPIDLDRWRCCVLMRAHGRAVEERGTARTCRERSGLYEQSTRSTKNTDGHCGLPDVLAPNTFVARRLLEQ
jgi:hypothetical protein